MTFAIDSHMHVWNLAKGFYLWPNETVPLLNHDFGIDDAVPSMEHKGVGAVILVQAADNIYETRHLLSIASGSDVVAGVIGWVPLDEPKQIPALIHEFRKSSKFVGVRSLIHTLPDASWISSPDLSAGLSLVAQSGLTFDYVTANPSALAYVPGLAQRHPDLSIVIDHLGKPPIGGNSDDLRSWARLLHMAAAEPTVFAKISGLYSSTGSLDSWTPQSLRPIILEALEAFGPNRLMWGSDWPVSTTAGGYHRTFDAIESTVQELAPGHRDEIFADNARVIYGIERETR